MLCLTFSKAFTIPDLVASGSGLSIRKQLDEMNQCLWSLVIILYQNYQQ
jgi:hypothetical protein